jgi:hypothetical protein
MGSRLVVPPTAAMPTGLSALGQKIWRAAQRYGFLVVDQAGSPMLYADPRSLIAAQIGRSANPDSRRIATERTTSTTSRANSSSPATESTSLRYAHQPRLKPCRAGAGLQVAAPAADSPATT